MNEKEIIQRVLKKIKPSKGEIKKEKKVIEKIIKKIKEIEGKHVDVVLAGSIARGTHLKGDRDIDLFVLFPEELSREEFVKEGLKIGKKVLRGYEWEEAFSEHPYIRGKFEGFDVEIVPSYKITDTTKLKSAVDRTPFHTAFLQKHLKEKQKDEVRLLRQFLKGIQCYGSDIKRESFPGYLVELLILKYGSFLNTLKATSKWKIGEVIDLGNFYSKKEAQKKFKHHLIVVDPTDKNRNVAAALSLNQFSRFICASNEFIKKPSIYFFFGKKTKLWKIKKVKEILQKKALIGIESFYPVALSDLIWGQLRRVEKKIRKELELNEFNVIRTASWTDEKKLMVIIIELKEQVLEKTDVRIGPFVSDTENSKKFLLAHKKVLAGPRIEKGRWVIEVKRKYWNAVTLLKEYIKKVKAEAKFPIRKGLNKKCKVIGEKEMLEHYKKNKEFAEFFTEYLKGKEKFLEY